MKLFQNLIASFSRPTVPSAEVPTTAIYFSRLVADLISDTKDLSYPIWRLESNVFHRHGENPVTLVSRYCSPAICKASLRGELGRIVLLLDDNFWAIDADSGLDATYRARLGKYRDETLAPLLRLAEPLVVSSPEIARSAGIVDAMGIDPAMIRPAGGTRHFAAVDSGLKIVFPATRSHLVDLVMIADELAAFLHEQPDAHLTTFLGHNAPAVLKVANATHRAALDWPAYEAVLGSERFHLSIAPATDSLFNRSRSLTRLLDNAYLGAAGFYSDAQPFNRVVTSGRDGWLVGREAGAWHAALRRAWTGRADLAAVSEAGQALARNIGDRQKWRRFWLDVLGLPPE